MTLSLNAQKDIVAEDVLYGRNGSLILSGATLGNVRSVEAQVNVSKAVLQLAGTFVDRHRRIGWGGTGTLRIYRINDLMFEQMLDAIDPAKAMPVFELDSILENNDPHTQKYKEKIRLKQVKFWDYSWMWSVEDFVDQPLGFTFEGIGGAPDGIGRYSNGKLSPVITQRSQAPKFAFGGGVVATPPSAPGPGPT